MPGFFTKNVLLVVLLFATGFLQAQEEMYLGLSEDYSQKLLKEDLSPYIKIFEDSTNSLAYADVLLSYVNGEFTKLDEADSLYDPERESNWWMAIPVKSDANSWQEFWFNAGGKVLVWDSVDIYTLYADKHMLEQNTGRSYSREKWKGAIHPNFFSIKLNAGDSCLVLLSLQNHGKAHLSPDALYFTPVDYESALNTNLKERFSMGLFLGILCIQLLFFLMFFLSTRSETFGYYVLYIMGLTGVVFFMTQAEFHLIRINLSTSFIISVVFVLCALIGLLRFSVSYLNIKTLLPNWEKPTNWYEAGITGLTLFLIISIGTFINDGDTHLTTEDGMMSVFFILAILLYILMFVLLGISLLYWGVHTMRKGFKPARFYLLGNSVFILGVLLYILSLFLSIGQIHIREILSSMELIRGGIVLQLCLFAVALGAKRNLLEKEKRVALEANLELQKEKRMALEANLELQKIVNTATDRFVPYQFLQILGREDITEVTLGDQVERNSTVFFSDIRNYTTLSEKLSPQETFEFLNSYLGRVGPIIESYGGFVNQFLGDGIMALFMERKATLSASEKTLRAAIKIQEEIQQFNQSSNQFGIDGLRMGIGIHHGPLMLGVIGDEQRMDIGVVSDTVNTASRMEGLTKIFGASIIISEVSYQELQDPDTYTFRYLGKVKVKGRQQALGIYDCYDAENTDIFDQKSQSEGMFDEGLQAYLAKDFQRAKKSFQRVLQDFPMDTASKFYLKKTKTHLSKGIPEGWDGVLMMNKK